MQNIRGSAPPEVLSAHVCINIRGSDPPEVHVACLLHECSIKVSLMVWEGEHVMNEVLPKEEWWIKFHCCGGLGKFRCTSPLEICLDGVRRWRHFGWCKKWYLPKRSKCWLIQWRILSCTCAKFWWVQHCQESIGNKSYTKVQLQLINVLRINDRKTIWANLVAILIALLPTSFSLKCLGYSLYFYFLIVKFPKCDSGHFLEFWLWISNLGKWTGWSVTSSRFSAFIALNPRV